MTDNEMRIAIAEACGWKPFVSRITGQAWTPPDGGVFSEIDELPDFLNDLNAMHAAEKVLNRYQRSIFERDLGDIFPCDADGDTTGYEGRFRRAIHATARQRAEAFITTIQEQS